MDRTFTWGNARYCVHPLTVVNSMDALRIARIVSGQRSDAPLGRRYLEYGELLTTTVLVDGEAEFTLPFPDDTDTELLAGFALFEQQPDGFRAAWLTARRAANDGGNRPAQQTAEANTPTEALDDWLQAFARGELGMDEDEDEGEDDPLPETVVLNYPLWYVQRAWVDRRDHGIYPNGKPFDDQPKALIDDLSVLDRRFGRYFRQLLRERNETLGKPGNRRSPGLDEPLPEDFDDVFSEFNGHGATAPIRWD